MNVYYDINIIFDFKMKALFCSFDIFIFSYSIKNEYVHVTKILHKDAVPCAFLYVFENCILHYLFIFLVFLHFLCMRYSSGNRPTIYMNEYFVFAHV